MTNADGSISGVKAVRKDGSIVTVNCKSAVIATGGASASEEIMLKYFPNYTPYAENCGASTTDGEGLTMAWSIGAEKGDFGVHAHNHTMPLLAKYTGIDTVLATDALSCLANVPLLWLNRMGRRFNNEATAYSPTPGGNAVFGGKQCFVILDQTTVDFMAKNGTPLKPWRGKKDEPMPDLPAQLQTGIGVGYVRKGDTIEALASNCGMDPAIVAEEVTRYNTMVENGVDTDYGKIADALKFTVSDGPFYAVEIRPRILGSFGGSLAQELCSFYISELYMPVCLQAL
jgi:fumarate reductase flavoprotein subunit